MMRLETKRLILQQMTHSDLEAVAPMLKDIEVMYAWQHAFTDAEVSAWIDKRINGYVDNGFDYLLAVDKQSSEVVGQIGLLKERIGDAECVGIGHILARKNWGKGYAAEGAKACIKYAFDTLKADKVVATIRPENYKSVAVAKAVGMQRTGQLIKEYKGKEMPHDIYEIR